MFDKNKITVTEKVIKLPRLSAAATTTTASNRSSLHRRNSRDHIFKRINNHSEAASSNMRHLNRRIITRQTSNINLNNDDMTAAAASSEIYSSTQNRPTYLNRIGTASNNSSSNNYYSANSRRRNKNRNNNLTVGTNTDADFLILKNIDSNSQNSATLDPDLNFIFNESGSLSNTSKFMNKAVKLSRSRRRNSANSNSSSFKNKNKSSIGALKSGQLKINLDEEENSKKSQSNDDLADNSQTKSDLDADEVGFVQFSSNVNNNYRITEEYNNKNNNKNNNDNNSVLNSIQLSQSKSIFRHFS
jgi:hypothetical protein